MTDTTKDTVRPTKKQRELLVYIEKFIGEHGYSPSYREIMNGQGYTSVATVSLHVASLIRRGHLRKRDRSARSLEVVKDVTADESTVTTDGDAAHTQWLVRQVTERLTKAEAAKQPAAQDIADIETLLATLEILGSAAAVTKLAPRLHKLQGRLA